VHGEWNVVVVAPHFAAAFVARDLSDPADDDMARRFEFCLTYDRGLAVEAAGPAGPRRAGQRRVSA
jgi:DICT domain-containing protein